jgi:hypothetical protein
MEENGLQIWWVAANILNKQSRTAEKGWSSSLGLGEPAFMKCYAGPQNWMDSLEQPRKWKMDMRFGTLSVKSLYRANSVKTAARKLLNIT